MYKTGTVTLLTDNTPKDSLSSPGACSASPGSTAVLWVSGALESLALGGVGE